MKCTRIMLATVAAALALGAAIATPSLAQMKEQTVMVGGAPITKDWADKIKADGTSEDAVGAVKLAKQLVGKE